MKIRIAAAAVCTAIGMAAAGLAIAQAAWPQVTVGDLQACRPAIAQFHKIQKDWLAKEVATYCTVGGADYRKDICDHRRNWLNLSKGQEDVAWYAESNEHCEEGDYPCFGPVVVNDERSGADYIIEKAGRQPRANAGTDLWAAAGEADRCTAGLWVKKYNAAGGARGGGSSGVQPVQPAKPIAAGPITASDPTFQSNIKTFGADQLLALVNELLSTGNIDVAKLARNALLQRFPDSPLVPVVAQLITNASKPGAPAATPTPAPVSAPVTPVATGDRVFLNDGPSLISAFARAGVLMKAIPNSEEFQEGSNLFSAYLSNCSNGTCHAVQLMAKYSFNPMPSFDKVHAWNLKKLYGRAYIDNNRANFDMVILIPNAGIDIKALEEAIVLYKDASSAFYDSVKPQ